MSDQNNPDVLAETKAEVEKVTKTVGEFGKVFKEFTETNESNLKQRDVVWEEKLSKMGEALTQVAEVKSKLGLIEVAVQKGLIQGGKDTSDNTTTEQKAYNSGLMGYIRKGVDSGLDELQKKAMSVISDPDGGYLVTPTMSNRITKRIFESSPMRILATVETISSDSLDLIVDDDEASCGWVGETATRSDTNTPQVAKKNIPVHELHASPKATQKLLDDAGINIEQWLADKVADKFLRTEADAFYNGDGVAKPRGILTYSDWSVAGTYQRDAVEQVDSGASGDFDGDDLLELQGALKEVYRQGASWQMKRSVFTKLLKIKANSEYILSDFRTQNGTGFNLLGNPVYFSDAMAAAGSNSLSILYGNMAAAYTIVDRIGVRILRDPFTAKPYVVFYTTKRVGGDVVNFDAAKIMKLG